MTKKIFISSLALVAVLSLIFFLIDNESNNFREKQLYQKLNNGEQIKYLVVGDSIGESVGASNKFQSWTSLLNEKISAKYNIEPHAIFLTKGGSDVFDGLVEFSNYRTNKNYDLVFVSFGQNDQNSLSIEEYEKLYTSLINEIIKRFPQAEIVTIIENGLDKNEYKEVIEEISEEYDFLTFDAKEAFEKHNLPDEDLTEDGIHPNDKGYEIYAENIFNEITKYVNLYEGVNTGSDSHVEAQNILGFEKSTTPDENKGFSVKGDYLVSDTEGAYLEYKVESNELLGLSLISHKDGGYFNVYVDGEKVKTFSSYAPYKKERHFLINKEISSGVHTVKIIIEGPNKGKEQRVVRIKGILTK